MKFTVAFGLIGFLILQSCQCKPQPVIPTESVLQVTPRELQFGQVFVGGTKVLPIEISNAGKSPIEVQIESTAPFSSIKAISLQGGSVESVDVTFAPTETGNFSSKLKIFTSTEAIEVLLTGNGKPVPICAVEPCANWTFSYSTGQCEKTVKPDATSCTSACNSPGQCVSGECLSESAPSCNDNNLCTLDFCGGDGGCFHREKPIVITDACKVFRCEPDAGVVSNNVEDGVSCGEPSCAEAQICLNGTCLKRAIPNANVDCKYSDVVATRNTSCAKTLSGKLRCWGDGTLFEKPYGVTPPTVVSLPHLLTGFTEYSPVCLFSDDAGTVQCNGEPVGQFTHYSPSCASLFDGGISNCGRAPPVGIGPVSAVSSGSRHTCALASDASVVCWGERAGFATYDGGLRSSEMLQTLESIQAIRTGFGLSCALGISGKPHCFGDYQPPISLNEKRWTDLQLWSGFERHASGIHKLVGLLGDGSIERCHERCESMVGASPFTKVTAGNNHSCALTQSGDVFCWGENNFGQLADLSIKKEPFVIPINNIHLASSNGFTIANLNDGRVVAWGANDGDAGVRALAYPSMRVEEIGFEWGRHEWNLLSRGRVFGRRINDNTIGEVPEFGTDVIRLSKTLPCAISATSGLKCLYGQAIETALQEVGIQAQHVIDIEYTGSGNGPYHCVTLNDGGTSCFTREFGQPRSTAIHLNIPPSQQLEAFGVPGMCSLSTQGSVWCWSVYPKTQGPVLISGLTFPTRQISVGSTRTVCALSGANSVQCTNMQGPPTQIPMEEPVKQLVAAGGNCAIFTSGRMKCWGNNFNGQLGVSGLQFSDNLIQVTK
jgi:hypothetical protein